MPIRGKSFNRLPFMTCYISILDATLNNCAFESGRVHMFPEKVMTYPLNPRSHLPYFAMARRGLLSKTLQ